MMSPSVRIRILPTLRPSWVKNSRRAVASARSRRTRSRTHTGFSSADHRGSKALQPRREIGMPHLSARVSCERCSGLKETFQAGLTYQMFQAVEVVFAHRPISVIEGLERMRAHLIDQIHIGELRRNWYFLKCAIGSTQPGEHPRGALPYRIFAEYQRRFQCQSQADVLFARANKV